MQRRVMEFWSNNIVWGDTLSLYSGRNIKVNEAKERNY